MGVLLRQSHDIFRVEAEVCEFQCGDNWLKRCERLDQKVNIQRQFDLLSEAIERLLVEPTSVPETTVSKEKLHTFMLSSSFELDNIVPETFTDSHRESSWKRCITWV